MRTRRPVTLRASFSATRATSRPILFEVLQAVRHGLWEVGDAHRHAVDRLFLDSFDQSDLGETHGLPVWVVQPRYGATACTLRSAVTSHPNTHRGDAGHLDRHARKRRLAPPGSESGADRLTGRTAQGIGDEGHQAHGHRHPQGRVGLGTERLVTHDNHLKSDGYTV